jgi:hypothetical protein
MLTLFLNADWGGKGRVSSFWFRVSCFFFVCLESLVGWFLCSPEWITWFSLFRVVSCGLVVPVLKAEDPEPRTYTKEHEKKKRTTKHTNYTKQEVSFRSALIRLIRPIRIQKERSFLVCFGITTVH